MTCCRRFLNSFSAIAFFFVLGVYVVSAFSEIAAAEPLQFDIADDYVEITTGFTGTTLSMIGYRKGRGDIVLTLEGPPRSTVVRQKSQVFGAWVNRETLQFDNIPSYYDFALSVDDEKKLMSDELLKEYHVGLNALRVVPKEKRIDEDKIKLFQSALLRYKQQHQLYSQKAGAVEFLGDDFFRVDFHLPAHVPAGNYTVRALLVGKGKVVYEDAQSLRVGLTGFSSDIYEFSRNHAFLYGALCVLIACFAGWLSNFIVRRS
ncbi:MAG: TIGR02186 family protein [Rhodospirillales bacterium]|nr:TIGR02186 family protein [Alphaproteobacteria bacterium]USO05997.1 MAG: TIGR02186 family protein [Rhodospirillales bacterium]